MMDRGQHHSDLTLFNALTAIAAAATILIVGLGAIFVLGSSNSGTPGAYDDSLVADVGDSGAALPAYLMTAPQSVREAYVFASERPDVMRWIPCYCGCGGHSGHKSVHNCFVTEASTPTQVEWDSHGAGCDMCVGIALDAKSMTAAGKSLLEIRTYIDDNYSQIGPGTDTPMPPG